MIKTELGVIAMVSVVVFMTAFIGTIVLYRSSTSTPSPIRRAGLGGS